MTENEGSLAFKRGFSHWWTLYTEPIRPTPEDRERAFQAVEGMLRAFEGLLTPTRIRYTAIEAETTEAITLGDSERTTNIVGESINDDGIDIDEFIAECRNNLHEQVVHPYWVLDNVGSQDGYTTIRLSDGDHMIDKHSNLFQSELKYRPDRPPINISFFNRFYSRGARYCGVKVDVSRTDI